MTQDLTLDVSTFDAVKPTARVFVDGVERREVTEVRIDGKAGIATLICEAVEAGAIAATVTVLAGD
jgi:hypothetical protein